MTFPVGDGRRGAGLFAGPNASHITEDTFDIMSQVSSQNAAGQWVKCCKSALFCQPAAVESVSGRFVPQVGRFLQTCCTLDSYLRQLRDSDGLSCVARLVKGATNVVPCPLHRAGPCTKRAVLTQNRLSVHYTCRHGKNGDSGSMRITCCIVLFNGSRYAP